MLFVFANTGKEKEETLEFLKKLQTVFEIPLVWVEAVIDPIRGKGTSYKIVNFKTASRNGEPFKDAIAKYGIPSKMFRHCTKELKEIPIKKYTQKIFGPTYLKALGIRADEQHRIGKNPNVIYPLSGINIDKKFIDDWWNKQSFNLDLDEHQGNCDFCFLKSKRKRITLINEGLDVSWWNNMEIKYGTDKQPIFDVRNNLSIEKLIQMNNRKNSDISLLDDIDFDCFCKFS